MSDLISRQDIKYHTQLEAMGNGQYEEVEVAYKNDIESLPSADRATVDKEYLIDLIQEAVYDGEACEKLIDLVDRPTGEWIEVTNGRGGHECSECHSYAPSYASGDEHLSDYCPNCGARMYKGGEEE